MSETQTRNSSPEPYAVRFKKRLTHLESARAPVVYLCGTRPRNRARVLPFASLSILMVLSSLLCLSIYLGGWTWSSWTYAFSLSVAFPLMAIEIRRKAVITGGAALLLVSSVIIAAGLPQYFGYSASDLSWYDLSAHYLGALASTVFLWSIICWAVSPRGPPRENGRRKLLAAMLLVIAASVFFELAEFSTDAVFGWANFHAGIDTLGDLIFDFAGVLTAGFVISRHRLSAIRRPFWFSDEPIPA